MCIRAAAAVLLGAAVCPSQQIQFENGSGVRPHFRVVGWDGARLAAPPAARERFAVYVANASGAPPVLGAYRIERGVVIFEPRYPLAPGLLYRAVFRGDKEEISAVFEMPKSDAAPATVVEHLYPSTSRWPENQLKFYLHFSAPMSRGEAYRRVRLLDQRAKQVDAPFLELAEELWDRQGKRLTILFDPGRVKRGLAPHQEVGTPLQEGQSYTVEVDRAWLDAEGRPLKEEFRKSFRVGPPDREPPELKNWRLAAPRGGSAEPLALEFPEPLDRALLEHLLEVVDAKGNLVEGAIAIDRQETRWRFMPQQPWKAGEYSLRVATILEDLAGNTIGRPFEVDVFERVQERISRETVTLPFRILPAESSH